MLAYICVCIGWQDLDNIRIQSILKYEAPIAIQQFHTVCLRLHFPLGECQSAAILSANTVLSNVPIEARSKAHQNHPAFCTGSCCRTITAGLDAAFEGLTRHLKALPQNLKALPRHLKALPHHVKALPYHLTALPNHLKALALYQ